MSIGRTLANICTLGLWSFTDPDLEEFWKPIKGNVTLSYSQRRAPDAETIMSEFKWLKKDWSKDRKPILISSYKNSDALCDWIADNNGLFSGKEGLEIVVWAPYYQAYTREVGDRTRVFCADGHTIHCRECGEHIAYGTKKHKRFKCSAHPKAGNFLNKPKKASTHEYVGASGSYWGVNVEGSDIFDGIEDDYTDD